MTRKSVQGGYCASPDSNDCALESTDCSDPSNFQSARQMQGAPLNAHGGSCRWQSSVTSHTLGRCIDDTGLPTECAPNIDSCPAFDGSHGEGGFVPQDAPFPPPRDWVANAMECGVEKDVYGDKTLYGRCDYGMCAWSHEHCTEDNTWEPFSEGCTCDQVQVGGCSRDKDGGVEVYCAVSSLACDAEQTWIVPQEVKRAAGFDCYLCREVSPPAPESDPLLDGDLFAGSGGSGAESGQTTLIVVGVVGAVLALSIIGLVGYKVLSKKRDARRRALETVEQAGPPATTIQIAKGHENLDTEYGQNLTDMDNASVLSEDSK